QRFGLSPDVILRTGEARTDLRTLLREEVLTRRFQSARALGMIRGNIELAAKLAVALEIMSPMLDATKAAWCEADAKPGSAADHTAIIRWLERLELPKEPSSSPERAENVADA